METIGSEAQVPFSAKHSKAIILRVAVPTAPIGGGGGPPVPPEGGGGVSLIRVRSITGTGGETSSDKESGPGWAAGGRGWLCQLGLLLASRCMCVMLRNAIKCPCAAPG